MVDSISIYEAAKWKWNTLLSANTASHLASANLPQKHFTNMFATILINVFSKMDNETEDIECTCGHSGDGHCHCCECTQEQTPIYEEIDQEEFINQLNDWD